MECRPLSGRSCRIMTKHLFWARAGLAVSGFVVVAAGYPWGDIVGHTHWSRVGWIPFLSWPVRPLDVAGNLLLCVPLGMVAARAFNRGVVVVAGAIALALSLFVETMQLYSHGRFPSATDVVCNVTGAVAAAALVRAYRARTGEVRS